MRAGIYIRVSTDAQSRYGTSLETQEAACRAAAEEEAYIVAEEHIWRETYSGRVLDRPELIRMMEVVRSGALDAIWVYHWDRLSRSGVHMVQIMRDLAECGVQTYFVRGTSRPGASGELLTFIQGWAGEQEAAAFIERSKRNKVKRAQQGIYPNGDCRGVYGYDYIPGANKRVINEAEAAVVHEIFDRVEAEDSLNSIAFDFNSRGVPTKRGGTWDGATIKNILRRTSYYGVDFYGRTRVQNGVRTPLPREEWVQIDGYSPPIMSRERHEAANRSYDARTKRRAPAPYLLTGFITCSICGGPVSGRSNLSKRYYRCRRTASSPTHLERGKVPHICQEFIETWVWEEVCRVLGDPRTIMGILSPVPQGTDQIDAQIASLRKQQDAVARDQGNLVNLSVRNTIPEPDLEAALANLKREWGALDEEVQALEDQRMHSLDWARQAQAFSARCRVVSEHLADPLSFAERSAILHDFGVTITTDGKAIEVGVSVDTQTPGRDAA